jgi:hypothetical protein
LLNMSVLGSAVAGGVALMSWPVVAIGGVAYLALVASDVSNVEFRRRVLFGREPAAPLTKPETFSDPRVRQAVAAIFAARADIAKTMKATPPRIARNVQASIDALKELELHAATLAGRADALSGYLASNDVEALRKEIDSHRSAAKQARDRAVRADYERAAVVAQDRQTALQDIAASLDRAHANLAKIVATFRGIPSKLVRLRTLDDQASDALSGDVESELERMNLDLRTFEQTLEGIV